MNSVEAMFKKYDTNGNGALDLDEFTEMLEDLGVAPQVDGDKQEKKPECATE
jgi:hypothetical protein